MLNCSLVSQSVQNMGISGINVRENGDGAGNGPDEDTLSETRFDAVSISKF